MKKIMAIAGALVLLLLLAGPATAAPPVPQPVNDYNKMHVAAYTYNVVTGVSVESNCSKTRWIDGPDAPNAFSNDRRLATHLCAPNPGVSSEYSNFWTDHSVNLAIPVDNVKNLGFDRKIRLNGTDNAGAPRISVEVDTDADGVSDLNVFLAARYCEHPFSSGGPAEWTHSEFTGFKHDCGFYDGNSAFYAADGTHTAWHAFAVSHPGAVVTAEYGVMDEGPGNYGLDGIKFVNRLYNIGPNKAIFCGFQEYGVC